jgi:CRISPR-associated protein Csx10
MNTSSSEKKLKLRLDMKSDWHVGTGSGIPGSIDALLARDSDGFPCVPAKTVIGIWRDALELLTLGLDEGAQDNKVWQRWVDVIFGSQPSVSRFSTESPRPSILSLKPARLDENLRRAIGEDEQLRQVLTFLKPNTAIDFDSGAAKSKSLRFTEMGRIGTVLETEFKLDFDIFENDSPHPKELIEALLVGSAALVERIGGNRRRGAGKCELHIEGLMPTDVAVKTIRRLGTDNSLNGFPNYRQRATTVVVKSASGNNWKRMCYSLELETPVAIVTNTFGNVSETLDFIPGTYLLPHLTKHLRGVAQYVASGDFQVSPATIDINGMRGLPVPRVFLQEKLNETNVCNGLNETEESLQKKPQLKPLRQGFVSLKNGNFTYANTPKVLLMHNTIEDRVQRPTANVVGVFSRQAIKAGTILRGELRFKGEVESLVQSAENSESSVRLGTSKKDDYGLATLRLQAIEPDSSNPQITDARMFVYFESDVLLRNENLRQTSFADCLRVQLEDWVGKNTLEEQPEQSLIHLRRIESWHEGWGLPRPTLTPMAAGSVVTFKIKGNINPTTLKNIERRGIGERRAEGYGRIRFNPSLLTDEIKWNISEQSSKPVTEPDANALAKLRETGSLKEFLFVIGLAAWRDELAKGVLKLATDKDQRQRIFGFEISERDGKRNSIPSLSQIGGLRSAISRLLLDGSNKSLLIGWLDHLASTENRRKIWDSEKDGYVKKLARIKELISDENKVWLILCETKLHGQNVWCTPKELVQNSDRLRQQLWVEAIKSLFDACVRAHKRELERE